jgi:alkyl sulfatase BDS1-like metallo-beta-lactamase superfamily hydrolase
VHQGLVGVEGDGTRVVELFGLLDDFSPTFAIVEPKPEP